MWLAKPIRARVGPRKTWNTELEAKLDGTGSWEPTEILSRGLADSEKGVPEHFRGGCDKKLGLPCSLWA